MADNLHINMAKMEENVDHTRERVDHLHTKLDNFINKAERNYATKSELCNKEKDIEENKANINNIWRLMRTFLIGTVLALLTFIGFLITTATDIFVNL